MCKFFTAILVYYSHPRLRRLPDAATTDKKPRIRLSASPFVVRVCNPCASNQLITVSPRQQPGTDAAAISSLLVLVFLRFLRSGVVNGQSHECFRAGVGPPYIHTDDGDQTMLFSSHLKTSNRSNDMSAFLKYELAGIQSLGLPELPLVGY